MAERLSRERCPHCGYERDFCAWCGQKALCCGSGEPNGTWHVVADVMEFVHDQCLGKWRALVASGGGPGVAVHRGVSV